MSDYLEILYASKENHISYRYRKCQRKILSSFEGIASYKFTKIRWAYGQLPVYSPSA